MSGSPKNHLNKLNKYNNLRISLDDAMEAFSIGFNDLKNEPFCNVMKMLLKQVYDNEIAIFDTIDVSAVVVNDPVVNPNSENPSSQESATSPPDNFSVFFDILLEKFNTSSENDQFYLLVMFVYFKDYEKLYTKVYKNTYSSDDIFNKMKNPGDIIQIFKKICRDNFWHNKISHFAVQYENLPFLLFKSRKVVELSVFEIFRLHFSDQSKEKFFPTDVKQLTVPNSKVFVSTYEAFNEFNEKSIQKIGECTDIRHKPTNIRQVLFKYPFLYTDNNGKYSFYSNSGEVMVFRYEPGP